MYFVRDSGVLISSARQSMQQSILSTHSHLVGLCECVCALVCVVRDVYACNACTHT
jgi:hypothetical protein